MSRRAKDGTEYTNQMSVNKHNMRMDSQKESKKSLPSSETQATMDDSSGTEQDGSQSPDAQADSHVDAMLDMGMSPDEIHEHAKKRAGMEQEAEPATHSLSSIPGM